MENKLIWKTDFGWSRLCPKCNSVIEHKGKYSKYNAVKSHKQYSLCFNCSNADITEQLVCNNFIWSVNKNWYRKCPKCKCDIEYVGDNSKTICSVAHRKYKTCNSCANSKIYSEKSKQKMREAVIRRIKKYGIHTRNFNPLACDFIDKLNGKSGYNFQHALNGGEVSIAGYLVDGYDKEKNIVFEYDEPIHHTPSYRTKDNRKQQTIIDTIKPNMFIRYDEKINRLYDVITNNSILWIDNY